MYRSWRSRSASFGNTLRTRVVIQIVICAGFLLPGLVFGQQANDPDTFASASISPTLYFPSAAAEASSRADLRRQIEPMIKGLSMAPLASLSEALNRAERLVAKLQTHAAYLKV